MTDLAALAQARKDAVALAAFWGAFADAIKVVADAARTEAVQECGAQGAEKTTATDERGNKLGALSRSEGHSEWAVADGRAARAYFEKTYPDWIEVTPAYTRPAEFVPEARRIDPVKLAEWLTTITMDGVDPETGADVADWLRWDVTEGRWTLTKDKAAKQRVLAALKVMLDQGVRMPAEARKMIEGGR